MPLTLTQFLLTIPITVGILFTPILVAMAALRKPLKLPFLIYLGTSSMLVFAFLALAWVELLQ